MITATAIEFQTARATTLGLQRALNRGRLRQSQREVGMRQPERGRVRRPRADDRLMRDVLFGISGYAAVLVAHDLKLTLCLPRSRAPYGRSVMPCTSPRARLRRWFRLAPRWASWRSGTAATPSHPSQKITCSRVAPHISAATST